MSGDARDELPSDLVNRLTEIIAEFDRKEYPSGSVGAAMDAAVSSLTARCVRELAAALCLIKSGWAPESHVHIRATWDLAVDLWFLLSLPARERVSQVKRYGAMAYLRAHAAKGYVASVETGELPESVTSERYQRAHGEFGDEKIEPHKHWSGVPKGDVRKAANAAITEVLGEIGLTDAIRGSKSTLFDYPSSMVHGDPGAIITLPLTERGTIQTGPDLERTSAAARLAPAGIVGVGVLVLAGVNRRRGAAGHEETKSFYERVREYLSDPGASGRESPSDPSSNPTSRESS